MIKNTPDETPSLTRQEVHDILEELVRDGLVTKIGDRYYANEHAIKFMENRNEN
jgi:predicted transcriptional regulator